MLTFRLLGAVEIRSGARRIDPGPPRLRGVLAALLADVGQVVTAETLISRVWGDTAPPSAHRSLQSHIARLRGLLQAGGEGEDQASPIVRRFGGYVLAVDPAQVDVHRAKRLRAQALDAELTPDQRVALLREAVDLWSGEPLPGVPGDWAARTRAAWTGIHVDLLTAWAAAEIRIGRPELVIGPLEQLAAENPLNESVVTTQMQALRAAGRSAEALTRYDVMRRRLADELGVDPSHDLRTVYEAVLRGEQPAAAVDEEPVPRPADAVLLPADLPSFAGRATDLARLDALLDAGSGGIGASTVGIVSGAPGIGKTSLALRWAHLSAHRFPGGQLYVNLRGFDADRTVVPVAEAARELMEALGVPRERMPAGGKEQLVLYQRELRGRRILVVLDNARDADQVRPLLPAGSHAFVLVTSRTQMPRLVALDGAHPLELRPLDDADSRALLSARLGRARVDSAAAAVGQIIQHCGGLPLALAITAARAAHTGFSLSEIARELADGATGLDVLDGGEPSVDVRTVFSWSYAALPPPAQNLYRSLGVAPGHRVDAAAAASLVNAPPGAVKSHLVDLATAHMVEETLPGTFTMHDLLATYALELSAADPAVERDAAIHRILDHYLHSAVAGSALLDPYRDPIGVEPPLPGVVVSLPRDRREALAWFTARREPLVAAVRLAADASPGRAWRLAWAVSTFLDITGRWDLRLQTMQVALEAGQRTRDTTAQAHGHRGVGYACLRLGDLAGAHRHLDEAAELHRQAHDRVGEANTLLNKAQAFGRDRRSHEALEHARNALRLYQLEGHRVGEALARNSIGWHNTLLGRPAEALDECREALAILRSLDDLLGVANAWDSVGFAHHGLGQHREAEQAYRQALELFDDLGDRFNRAITLQNLAQTYEAAGRHADGREALQEALAILEAIDHPDAARLRARLEAS